MGKPSLLIPMILFKINLKGVRLLTAGASLETHCPYTALDGVLIRLHPSYPCFHGDLYKRKGGDTKRRRGPLATEFVLIIVTQKILL